MSKVDKIVMERVGEYKKYFIGETLIAVVPSDDSLYDPLIGKTAKKAYDYVKANQDDFGIASLAIRIGLLDLFSHYSIPAKGEYVTLPLDKFEVMERLAQWMSVFSKSSEVSEMTIKFTKTNQGKFLLKPTEGME